MKETLTVQSWLAARKPADETPLARDEVRQPFKVAQSSADNLSQALVLDVRHNAVLLELVQRSSWSPAELRAVTGKFGVMPWACVAAINEWATEKFGDLLLEGEEIINVNLKLKRQIKI